MSKGVTQSNPSNRVLRLAWEAGGLRVVTPTGMSFDRIRGQFHGRVETWLEVCDWVDRWPVQFGLLDELAYGDVSLWWLARYRFIEQVLNLFRDVEAIAAAVAESDAQVIELTGATSYWTTVCEVAAEGCRVELRVRKASGRRWASVQAGLGLGVALAARSLVGLYRSFSHELRPHSPTVLALGYSTWRRVNHLGRTRYIDPNYTPVLDELRRRRVSQLRLSVPTLSDWQQEAVWVLRGDPHSIPIEVAWARWMSGALLRRRTDPERRLQRALRAAAMRISHASLSWRSFDVSGPVGVLVQTTFVERILRGLRHILFFEELISREKPRVLLLTSEYSGVAMAATIAARRLHIPVVAVQHGVIWRGHPGYIVPHSQATTFVRPDVLCVFGEFERELLMDHGYGPQQVVVTGSPRLDFIPGCESELTRARLEAELGLPGNQRLLLFTSSGWHSRVVARRLVEQLGASERPLSVLVKLHPIYEAEPEAFVAAERTCPHLRVIREEYDLYDLLRIVDVHVSPNSTVLSEAAVFDRPNILFCTDLFPDTVGYVARGVAVAAEDFVSLGAAVDAVVHDTNLQRGRRTFVDVHYYKLDGGASSRVADVVETLAGGDRGATSS